MNPFPVEEKEEEIFLKTYIIFKYFNFCFIGETGMTIEKARACDSRSR